jgi:hypothetical protein
VSCVKYSIEREIISLRNRMCCWGLNGFKQVSGIVDRAKPELTETEKRGTGDRQERERRETERRQRRERETYRQETERRERRETEMRQGGDIQTGYR